MIFHSYVSLPEGILKKMYIPYAPCMEYLPTFARTKSPSFVGKYTSTMEHLGMTMTYNNRRDIKCASNGNSPIVHRIDQDGDSYKLGTALEMR